MIRLVETSYESFTLFVKVKTDRPEKIHTIFKDARLVNTVFTDRFHIVNGEQEFFIRCPVSGQSAMLCIYNEKQGNTEHGDKTFQLLDFKKVPLERKLDVVDFANPVVKSFVRFCTRFCFNAGWIKSDVYQSDDGRFTIEYVPVIISSKTNAPMATPARILKNSGHIQVAQNKYIPMTVPMRMAILLHEFSHYYINDNITDETEADLNGLLIYLGLGYPRIEAYEAFLKTFLGTPTQVNKVRYDVIDNFITKFENNQLIIQHGAVVG